MSLLVDFLSLASVVGIWPRFVEPRMLCTTELTWPLSPEKSHLKGLTIVHLTDLHFHRKISQRFLDKVARRVASHRPDLILFSGDFICYSELESGERLKNFLNRLEAPLGSYCIFGNHDYSQYVSRGPEGIYDLIAPPNPMRGVWLGLKTIFSSPSTGTGVSDRVLSIETHSELAALLKQTPFTLLDNATVTLPIGLNLTGLGDLALGRCHPERAYKGYDPRFPGLVLSHNPDTFPRLLDYPGDWIFSGHTHGEQIHLPWPAWARRVSQKLARLEHRAYTRGLFRVGDKRLYVNRGLGCHKPFRFCSPPEILVLKTEEGR